MGIYINGIGAVTIQEPGFLKNPEIIQRYPSNYQRCIEKDFDRFLSPVTARRMSRIIRRAIVSSRLSLLDAGIEMPDAVISGTGLGCIEDTEKFLTSMIENDEKFLQPTHFIQSTHNTISSQIAINLKCYNYNSTYAHLAASFDTALLDAFLQLSAGSINTALVGGHDEMTPAYFSLLKKSGYWKEADEMPLSPLSETTGSMAGEGSIGITLSNQCNEHSYCELLGVNIIYNPENQNSLKASLMEFLDFHQMAPSDINWVVTGKNGHHDEDLIYCQMMDSLFGHSTEIWYKHVCGEYYTASSFGLMAAAGFLRDQSVPGIYMLENRNQQSGNTLIYNHFRNKQHSFILLRPC